MSVKKDKNCYLLNWGRIFESFMYTFIISSIERRVKTNVIESSDLDSLEEILKYTILWYYTKKGLNKYNLVLLMSEETKDKLMKELYGEPHYYRLSFCGVDIYPLKDCLKNSVLLVDKTDAETLFYYEYDRKKYILEAEPAYEDRWVKVLL
jgi:hypothetical protein